jgi:hypothetical protein
MLLSGPPNGGPLSRLPATLSGGTTPRNPPVRAMMLGGPLAAFADGPLPGLGHPGHPARPSSDPS